MRGAQRTDQHPEGVFFAHVQQQHAGDESQSLAVANLSIVHRVGVQHVEQGCLAVSEFQTSSRVEQMQTLQSRRHTQARACRDRRRA